MNEFKEKDKVVDQVKQIKLLSDLVWGEEFGRLDWMQSEEEWHEMLQQYGENIISVKKDCEDYLGNQYEKIVGLLVVAFPKDELVYSEQVIVENEWYLSHSDNWQTNGSVCYFSEVIIHPKFRGSTVLKELMDQFYIWLREHKISHFYATGVTNKGHETIGNFYKSEVLQEKADKRIVYRISV